MHIGIVLFDYTTFQEDETEPDRMLIPLGTVDEINLMGVKAAIVVQNSLCRRT